MVDSMYCCVKTGSGARPRSFTQLAGGETGSVQEMYVFWKQKGSLILSARPCGRATCEACFQGQKEALVSLSCSVAVSPLRSWDIYCAQRLTSRQLVLMCSMTTPHTGVFVLVLASAERSHLHAAGIVSHLLFRLLFFSIQTHFWHVTLLRECRLNFPIVLRHCFLQKPGCLPAHWIRRLFNTLFSCLPWFISHAPNNVVVVRSCHFGPITDWFVYQGSKGCGFTVILGKNEMYRASWQNQFIVTALYCMLSCFQPQSHPLSPRELVKQHKAVLYAPKEMQSWHYAIKVCVCVHRVLLVHMWELGVPFKI